MLCIMLCIRYIGIESSVTGALHAYDLRAVKIGWD